ncbi:cytochrome c [Inquilinus limosus]|uniref:c-type cytochrome n=1 Tax=Inquilinus limosus TaxID=171674 RepID=UPI003F145918
MQSGPLSVSASLLGVCLAAATLAGEPPPITLDVGAARTVPDVQLRDSPLRLARILGPAQDFANNCQGCHGPGGVSVDEIPALAGRVGYFARIPEGRAYLVEVPNVAQSQLDSARIAALMNWMLRTFSPTELPADFQPYTAEEVDRLRRARINPVVERQKIIAMLVERGQLDDGTRLALKPFRNY